MQYLIKEHLKNTILHSSSDPLLQLNDKNTQDADVKQNARTQKKFIYLIVFYIHVEL